MKKTIKLGEKILLLIAAMIIVFLNNFRDEIKNYINPKDEVIISYDIDNIPEYNGEDYIIINDNKPFFKEEEIITDSFEEYTELDSLGRAIRAYANIGKDLMPSEKRERLYIKPTGFKIIRDNEIDGKYLYNRCHLIAYQLTGENENEKNLITCTRHMNAEVMTDFENKIGNYVRKTNNHVLYRVTPYYDGKNLVAKGINLEAYSVEDNGEEIEFNVFIYNVQPNYTINYKTGEAKKDN